MDRQEEEKKRKEEEAIRMMQEEDRKRKEEEYNKWKVTIPPISGLLRRGERGQGPQNPRTRGPRKTAIYIKVPELHPGQQNQPS